MRILIAGVGNVLRGDDGFGVTVVHRLSGRFVPPGVEVIDVGIGGIHLVQELMDEVDGLIVVDAVDLGRRPGTVLVITPRVVDVGSMKPSRRRDELADMHYATPERAFMLARAIGVLPEATWIVGCQPSDAERLGAGLSPPVEGAVEEAIWQVRAIVRELGVDW